MRKAALPALFFGYLLVLFAFLHRHDIAPVERDGLYHARFAQMLPSRLFSREFRWTQASTWRDGFCDKEFLYHVLLVPFTRDAREPLRGAQTLSALLGLAAFLGLYLLLRAESARGPLLFTAALACMGGPFLLRLSYVRSHVLSVPLAVLGLHFLLKRRDKALFVLGFIYAWSYTFPFVLFLIALPFCAGRGLAEGRWDWKPPLAALSGAALGLALHPYSPLTLETLLTYLQVARLAVAGRFSPVEVGREFAPYSTRSFLQAYPLLTAAVLGLGLAGWSTGKKLSPEALGAYCAAVFWFVMAMVFSRFIEYAAPLAAAACALAARDALGTRPQGPWRAALLGATLLCAHAWSLTYLYAMTAENDPPRFRGAAAWMEKNLAPEETVVNLWWDDFPDLFYDGYRQNYLCGLDPTYMLRFDPEKALALEAMRTGRRPLDLDWLGRTFGARYMVLRAPAARLYPALEAVAPTYADPFAVIFPLR